MVVCFSEMASFGKSLSPSETLCSWGCYFQGLIFLFIGIEFGMYIMIRQLVNTKEWLSACRHTPIHLNILTWHTYLHRARTEGSLEETATWGQVLRGTLSVKSPCDFLWQITIGMESCCVGIGWIFAFRWVEIRRRRCVLRLEVSQEGEHLAICTLPSNRNSVYLFSTRTS